MIFVKFLFGDYRSNSRDKREVSVVSTMVDKVIVLSGDGDTFSGDSTEKVEYRKSPRCENGGRLSRFVRSTFFRCRTLRSLEADCISCHDLYALSIAYLSMRFKRRKAALVYDAHEFELGRNVTGGRSASMRFLISWLEKFLIRRCDFTIVVNDSIADRMTEDYSLSQRPLVIRSTPEYWVLDYSQTERVRKFFCNSLSVCDDTFLIMYHGGLMRGRGIENVIRSVKELPDICAVVLGDGENAYTNELKTLAQDLGVLARILFLPAVSYDDLRHYVSAADCGLVVVEDVCESYFYMLPNKFFENIQSGTPIVVSNFPETSKIVNRYNIGLTCEPSDLRSIVSSIQLMRDNEALYAACKENLSVAKEELCWEREHIVLRDAYLGLFEECRIAKH